LGFKNKSEDRQAGGAQRALDRLQIVKHKMADFTEVIKRIKPSVTKEIEKDYEAFGGRSRKRIGEEVTKMHY
jgi:hypothetical protein